MAYNYNKAREQAKKIISKFGSASSLVRKGLTGGFDSEGNVEADSPDILINGIATPLVSYTSKEIDGTSIISGDAWVLFHTDSATIIEIDMQITINSKTFSVKNIERLSSVGDINIYTKLQLRK